MIDELRLDRLEDADSTRLRARSQQEGLRFRDVDTEGQDLGGIVFGESEVLGWNAHETQLRGARFVETRIENLNAPVLTAPRSTWKDARIEFSRIGSGELYESAISDTIISGSKLGWINLRGAELRDILFRSCSFEELDLSGAALTRVAFEDCAAGNLDISRATSQNLDLRGLRFASLSGLDSLTGTIITSAQAIALAELFAEHHGMRVEG